MEVRPKPASVVGAVCPTLNWAPAAVVAVAIPSTDDGDDVTVIQQ